MIFLNYEKVRSEYYLRRWQYYEKARHELTPREYEDAQVFFHAFRNLNSESKDLLTALYYYSEEYSDLNKRGYYRTVKPVKSAIIADKYDLTPRQIGEKVREAKAALKIELQKMLVEVKGSFILSLNETLYLLDFKHKGMPNEQYIIGREVEARVFHQAELSHEEEMKLVLKGFKKIPVN